MADHFNVIVLGAGNAGQVVARAARNAGKSVLLVESRDVGGTCPLRGCVPKKVLVAAAEALHQISAAGEHHIQTGPAKIDWEKLIDRKETFVAGVPEAMEKGLKKSGIEVLHAHAKFVAPDAIEAEGRRISGDKFVISTGSRPRKLEIPGGEDALTSDDILELKPQPDSLVFIGGGVISMEFSHVLARAGTKVTILQRGPSPLKTMEQDLVSALADETQRLGVDLHTSTKVQAVEAVNGGFRVRFEQNGETKTVEAERVANGAGRVAAVDDLDLKAAEVQSGAHGPEVDEYLRSVSNPNVFVAGDALGKTRALSPVASYEGKIVSHNLLHNEMIRPAYESIPSVVFTVPAFAGVGLTEKAAREKGLDFDVRFNNMKDWRSAKSYAETAALAKVLIEKESGKILGAHVLGHGAEEIIHTFAFAIKFGLPAQELKDFVYAYPTFTSDVRFLV